MTGDLTDRPPPGYGAVIDATLTPTLPERERRRYADTLTRSWLLAHSSVAVMSRSRELRAASRELMAEAIAARRAFSSWFRVEGHVDGLPVDASWRHGMLRCSPALLQRALLVVDLEDAFMVGDQGAIPASLDGGPLAALLTVIRACDHVTVVELSDTVVGPPVSARATLRH